MTKTYHGTISEAAPVGRTLSIDIDRPADEAYAMLAPPESFARWASWVAQTPEGPATVRFSERNSFGVLDHSVTLRDGTSVYVPLRVVPKAAGCELVLTLFRRPGVSDEKFAADAQWVMRDLHAARRLLEAG